MPEAKKPAAIAEPPEIEAEDTELAEIEQSVRSFDEAGLRRLFTERGMSEAEADALMAPMKAVNESNKRLLQRGQRQDAATYQATLREQFPYAFDAEGKPLFAGATKQEMRRTAERLHNHTAAIVSSAAAKPAARTEAVAAETDADRERAAEWGAPPSAAAEVVRETPDRTWDQLRSDAVHKPAIQVEETKRKITQDIKDNGPRQMRRRSLAEIASRQSQRAAREAAAAKA